MCAPAAFLQSILKGFKLYSSQLQEDMDAPHCHFLSLPPCVGVICAHAAFLRCCSRYLVPLRIEPEFSINRHCNANTLASGCHAIRSVIMHHPKTFVDQVSDNWFNEQFVAA